MKNPESQQPRERPGPISEASKYEMVRQGNYYGYSAGGGVDTR